MRETAISGGFWTLARTAAFLGLRAHLRKGGARKSLPNLLFFTDPVRTPDPEAIARRLPRGAGVVVRAFVPNAAKVQVIPTHEKGRPTIQLEQLHEGGLFEGITRQARQVYAYDLAGQGLADESSMLAAIRLARQLGATR